MPDIKPGDRTLKRRIQREEGFRHLPYQDTLGVWTVGYGSNLNAVSGEDWATVLSMVPSGRDDGGITEAQADYLLVSKIRAAVRHLGQYTWWPRMNRARQLALADMCYQLGPGGFHEFRKMRHALARGRWQRAHDEALASRWARQTPDRARRVAEALRDG